MIELKIERLVHGGQGLAHDETGHPYFVWNALPGETVLAERTKKTADHSEAIAREIVVASEHRIAPQEESYLSTSPWQIMDFDSENKMKMQIARETFLFHAGIDPYSEQDSVFSDGRIYGYRNKMEFSFYENDETGAVDLAFFARGQRVKQPVSGSMLAAPAINKAARHILEWVRSQGLTRRELKAVILRSNQAGQVIAGLFIKDEMTFEQYPVLTDSLVGFQLYYSTHKSPASVPTKLLYLRGQDYLDEQVNGITLRFGLFSFFQVNVPVFEQVLSDMEPFIDQSLPYLDYYSGVGTISLGLSQVIRECIQVEENEEAVGYARHNIAQQSVINSLQFAAHSAPAEKMLDEIASGRNLIVDPPRAGLHAKVVEKILEVLPTQIIYLSCNIITQARDLALLKDQYEATFSRLYNFFPRTPHTESLIILKKK